MNAHEVLSKLLRESSRRVPKAMDHRDGQSQAMTRAMWLVADG